MKILVIDDSEEIVEAVSLCVSMRWPEAELITADGGQRGLELVEQHSPDVVILDIVLKDMGGQDVLRSIRKFSDVPIVMLSVQDEDVEIARFLEEGADDYVVKPFSYVELVGRIQAVFRRSQSRARASSRNLQADDLLMDFSAAEVYKAGEPISLSRTELALLERLVRDANNVVSYESLVSDMAQKVGVADADSQVVKVHVQHLRSKLGDSPEKIKYIANVYGIGYKFLPQVAPEMVANGQRNGH